MLTTLEINAFTDSPRNLTVTARKQSTARMIRLLAVGARPSATCTIKNCPGARSPEQRLHKNKYGSFKLLPPALHIIRSLCNTLQLKFYTLRKKSEKLLKLHYARIRHNKPNPMQHPWLNACKPMVVCIWSKAALSPQGNNSR